jgi:calcium-dependent protein kinase
MGSAFDIVCSECVKDGFDKRDSYFIHEADNKAPENVIDIKIKAKDFIIKRTNSVTDVYERIQPLGQGAFGSVYKVKRKNAGTREIIRALKEISKKSMNVNKENEEEVRNEIEVLKNIDHPNIMKIFEFFEDEQNIYLINEFCGGGDVAGMNDKYGQFPEIFLKYIMYQIFLAVSFLHSNKVVHGDIKRENIAFVYSGKKQKKEEIEKYFTILFKDKELQEELNDAPGMENLSDKTKSILDEMCNYEMKILDFGSSKMKKKGKQYEKLRGITGTVYYCSPEVIKEKYDYECDEWACGVMMYILLTGIPPFDGEDEEKIFESILEEELNLDIPQLKNVSDPCKDLIKKLLEKNPKKRIKADEALKHEFFTTGINVGNLLKGKFKENSDYLKKMFNNKNILRGKKNSKFRDMVIAYIALNFTDQNEEKKVKQIFMEISGGNKHYLITKDTFVSRMEKIYKALKKEDIEDLFDTIDENKTGNIEYEELIRALSDKEKLLNDKNLREAFNFFDKDGSGSITWNEIAEIIDPEKKIPKDIIKEFLNEIGEQDENMKMNYFEFKRILRAR